MDNVILEQTSSKYSIDWGFFFSKQWVFFKNSFLYNFINFILLFYLHYILFNSQLKYLSFNCSVVDSRNCYKVAGCSWCVQDNAGIGYTPENQCCNIFETCPFGKVQDQKREWNIFKICKCINVWYHEF